MCRMVGDMSLVTCATWTASDPLSSSKSSSPLRVIPEHDMDTGLGLALAGMALTIYGPRSHNMLLKFLS